MTRALFIASVVASSSLVAAVYIISGYLFAGGILLVIGLTWIIGLLLRWTWISVPGLFAVYGFTAAGFFLEFSPGLGTSLTTLLLLCGGLSGLLAWDLFTFHFRLRLASPEDDIRNMENRHFLRLAAVGTAGLALSLVTLMVRVKFSFEWSVVLILLGVWGIGRVVRWLMQS